MEICLSLLPLLPMIMALCASRSKDGGEDAAQAPFRLELVDDDGAGIGQLVAGPAEDLLADDLRGKEALAAVSERIGTYIGSPSGDKAG